MSKIEVKLPEMGEGIIEATITQYLVAVGDTVEIDTPIVEVATDKVDSEVVSPHEGTIVELLHEEGAVVAVGAPIAIVEAESGEAKQEAPKETSVEEVKTDAPTASDEPAYTQFLSPTVKALLEKYDLPLNVLDKIEPTGEEGRITKYDVEQYIEKQSLKAKNATVEKQPRVSSKVKDQSDDVKKTSAPKLAHPVALNQGDEIEEMSRMRKLIAEHMVQSVQTAPHVTSFIEVDLTNLVNWRNKIKKEFEKKYGERLTFTTLFIEAVVHAIEQYPMINISVDGDKIIKRKAVNVGMATALPDGNLIVPVIQNADTLSLPGVAAAVNDLANKARNNKLAPTDIKGGTFTLTNVGAFDSLTGTPIINQPQVAILAVGAIQKKPGVVRLPDGNYGLAVRDIMMLALSYDHRVVNGGLGGNFLKAVRDYLQNFDDTRTI